MLVLLLAKEGMKEAESQSAEKKVISNWALFNQILSVLACAFMLILNN